MSSIFKISIIFFVSVSIAYLLMSNFKLHSLSCNKRNKKRIRNVKRALDRTVDNVLKKLKV